MTPRVLYCQFYKLERFVLCSRLFRLFRLFRRLQGIEDKAEEGAEILEHFEFVSEDESQMDRHQLVKYGRVQ